MSFEQIMLIPLLNKMTYHLNILVELIDIENRIVDITGFGKEELTSNAAKALEIIKQMEAECRKVGCKVKFVVKDKKYSWSFVEA